MIMSYTNPFPRAWSQLALQNANTWRGAASRLSLGPTVKNGGVRRTYNQAAAERPIAMCVMTARLQRLKRRTCLSGDFFPA